MELRDLLGQLAEGQFAALEPLYLAYSDEFFGLALWRTGSAEDAADVVQEVFVRLVSRRDRLAALRDPLSYLRKMVHRVSIDVHRSRKRRREDPIETCAFLEATEANLESEFDARRVSGMLQTLPPAQREAIYLRQFRGCSFAEIARATGVPVFTAASRYRIGIQRMRRKLGVKS